MGATNTKKSKYTFAKIPGVPGCTYYLTIQGKNRTLICTENNSGKFTLYALDDGHKFVWDIVHFSYMLRQHRWQDPFVSSLVEKIEVEHTEHQRPAFKTREYTKEEFDGLIDDIDNVTF